MSEPVEKDTVPQIVEEVVEEKVLKPKRKIIQPRTEKQLEALERARIAKRQKKLEREAKNEIVKQEYKDAEREEEEEEAEQEEEEEQSSESEQEKEEKPKPKKPSPAPRPRKKINSTSNIKFIGR